MSVVHESVLLREVMEWLRPVPGDVILDCTVGLGGHAREIVRAVMPKGLLIGIDKDEEAIGLAKNHLAEFERHVVLVHDDFRNAGSVLQRLNQNKVRGVLMDLGVSSLQLLQKERGFSFRQEGPLDMRMDKSEPLSAYEVVNTLPEKELARILYEWGEERYSRSIARGIVASRKRKPFQTTQELADTVTRCVPGRYRHGRNHPATRTFQAVRIYVNHELESIQEGLLAVFPFIEPTGRLAAISFHSLEDRLIKRQWVAWQKAGQGQILTKKPVMASAEEVAGNPKARSAKLRVFEKQGM